MGTATKLSPCVRQCSDGHHDRSRCLDRRGPSSLLQSSISIIACPNSVPGSGVAQKDGNQPSRSLAASAVGLAKVPGTSQVPSGWSCSCTATHPVLSNRQARCRNPTSYLGLNISAKTDRAKMGPDLKVLGARRRGSVASRWSHSNPAFWKTRGARLIRPV